MSLEDEVLAEIKPTPEEVEAVHRAAAELKDLIRKEAKKAGIPGEPLLVGSVAKDTFLKDPEIDIFVTFPPSTSRPDLERWGLELGGVLDSPTRRYAEHPYTRGSFRNYDADVVPCYKLDKPSARMSAVDRTPFHMEYVREKLQERDQVRLLKQFLKGIGTYGAEASIQGFSGYLCELLVLRYGSFKAVLNAAQEWRPQVQLRLEMEPEREFEEPLVFVDPVDGQRNAASAVSTESLSLLILAAREYMKAPAREFFFPSEIEPMRPAQLEEEMKSRETSIILISSSAPDLPEDVLFPQVRKAEHAIGDFLSANDFEVLRSMPFLFEKQWCVLVEVVDGRLPPVKKHLGPPPWLENAHDFTQKWRGSKDLVKGPYVESDRLVVEIVRRHVAAAQAVRDTLPTLSLGKHLDERVQRGYSVLEGKEIIQEGQADALSSFLDRRLPWKPRK